MSCSICRNEGHNSKTCPNKDASNGLDESYLPLSDFDYFYNHDGDGLVIFKRDEYEDGHEIRIFGIDAPEIESCKKTDKILKNSTKNISERKFIALGESARKKLKEILGCDFTVHAATIDPEYYKTDNYSSHRASGNRVLAYVTNEKFGDIGLEMIKQGYSVVWPQNTTKISIDFKHEFHDKYVTACCESRNENRGLWKKGLLVMCPLQDKKKISIDDCKLTCNTFKEE